MKYSSAYVGTVDNDPNTVRAIRTALSGYGFRVVLRGRGPRDVVLAKCGRYTAQSDFPLYLNPPKVAVYLRHRGKRWSAGCNDRLSETVALLVGAFPITFRAAYVAAHPA